MDKWTSSRSDFSRFNLIQTVMPDLVTQYHWVLAEHEQDYAEKDKKLLSQKYSA